MIELSKNNLSTKTEKEIRIYYEHTEVGCHRLDVLVENQIIVELKTVEALSAAHYAQLRSYLKAMNLEVGILVNFSKERADYRRIEMKQRAKI